MGTARHRNALPQLAGGFFVSDGGIETSLLFGDGLELPDFAAFHLLRSAAGEEALRRYFRAYAEIAERHGAGLILETATWRASADWGRRLGYSASELADANRRSVAMLEALRPEFPGVREWVISGAVGPRGDGYDPSVRMSEAEAEAYHAEQIQTFAEGAADLVTAITMNYAEEAIGIARAARRAGLPVVLSFTVETDGRLPTGQALGDALSQVDDATDGAPAYYMINCAHPTHFAHVLEPEEPWIGRVRGLRANASRKSHAELNEAKELDIGDPAELGAQYAELRRRLPHLNVMGGCCGTDARHVGEIARACAPLFAREGVRSRRTP
jgi:S-methylmethionine-dependent homocysteine/selenocysteine methylase